MRKAWVSRVGMVALVGILVLAGNPYTAIAGKPVPPPAPAMPRVVDANNVVVGQVVGATGPAVPLLTLSPYIAVVALNISVPSIVVQVTSTDIVGNAELFFTDSSCTGQPYFLLNDVSNPFRLFPIVGVANGTLYSPRANSASVAISTTYKILLFGNCQSGSTENYIIADPISDLSTQFTPPYRFVYP